MILFVDYEHASSRGTEWGREIMRLRTEINYKLEDLAGEHCMLVRYDRITDDLVAQLDPTAMFISGNGTNPNRYLESELEASTRLIRSRSVPTFGLCGGFQLMAIAFGVPLTLLGPPRGGEDDQAAADASPFASASVTEIGYAPVELLGEHRLFEGLGDDPVFRHAHMFQVADLPGGFTTVARTELTELQMVVDNEHRMVGAQFHPESWTDEHPAGERLIQNFLDWARA
ncbi:MAG: GMP synthase-like glutamine amidotransferase [Candidatus Aldehydirespiratoraceae bacterium]|jgi:GMP synthase-like glutamine amidotransferase